ncbi:MAG: hypothetical protein EP330_26075 [Deltaproteobacteria bacterium]|nr:MAG: hypothetical protein EP330_26075 [Deltaproteobacteria bacterium]
MTPAADMPPEPPQIELHGWVEAGVAVDEQGEGTVSVDLARFQTRLEHGSYAGMIQFEGKSGTVELLDAVVRLGPAQGLSVRAGQFKTPFSMEFGIPAPKLILPTRLLVVSAAPRRELGAELRYVDEVVDVQVGLFDSASPILITGPGVRPVGAVDVTLADWHLHAGVASWLHGGETEHGPSWDHEADVGVGWHHEGSTLAVEGLVARAVATHHWDAGVGALAAQRIHAGSTDVEPAVGYDAVDFEGEVRQRVTTAFNVHLDEWHAVTRLSWEAEIAKHGEEITQVARAQLQVGF